MSDNKKIIEKKHIENNGEILFIYDAENSNPNGDPDNENKPRMDIMTSTNLVTDVRLKRYIRDYLEIYLKKPIYVTNPEGVVLNAADRLRLWQWRKMNPDVVVDENTKKAIRKVKIDTLTAADVLDEFIDTRLFGATIPISAEEGTGSSINFIGPVQFNWGKSFNQVELVDSSGITSHFSSKTATQGTMGTDYRVNYSLIGFHGIINVQRAISTHLTTEDLDLFDKSIIESIPKLATRSKIGQYPRFYMRIIYKKDKGYIGDLRKYISLNKVKDLRTIKDVAIDFTELYEILKDHKDSIKKILYWVDPNITFDPSKTENKDKFNSLN